MVRSNLSLFLKFELKRFFTLFIIIFLIILFLESNQRRFKVSLYLYLGLFMIIFGLLIFYLQIKVKKIFLILDTKLKQEQFKDENGINSVQGRRFKAKYNNWLLKNAERNKINNMYKDFFNHNSQFYCLYCCSSTIPIIIVWSFSNMYMTSAEALIVSFSFVGSLVLLGIILGKREIGNLYKQLDSEIKQILFEEVTGYDPLHKGKCTFKYKAWLILNE